MTQYTAQVEAWKDAVDFNTLAEQTFGVQFAPEITEITIDGEHSPMYGYDISWGVNDAYAKRITMRKIKKMCDQLEYGHHIADSITQKEPA